MIQGRDFGARPSSYMCYDIRIRVVDDSSCVIIFEQRKVVCVVVVVVEKGCDLHT